MPYAKLVVLLGALAGAGVASCGGGEPVGVPGNLAGRIDAINESKISWDGLRLSLACNSTLTEMGQEIYHAGAEYRAQAIGAQRTFAFDLPARIEAGWYGRFTGQSCVFWLIAYNDANGNGRLDYEGADKDPYDILRAQEGPLQLVFVRNPGLLAQAGIETVVGWNYSVETLKFRHDFDKQFVLQPLVAPSP